MPASYTKTTTDLKKKERKKERKQFRMDLRKLAGPWLKSVVWMLLPSGENKTVLNNYAPKKCLGVSMQISNELIYGETVSYSTYLLPVSYTHLTLPTMAVV